MYAIAEDRGNIFKITCLSKDGSYITDFYREPTPKFLKELQKSTNLIYQLPRREIRKEEDLTKKLQREFKKLHQKLINQLEIDISYPYTLLVNPKLQFENSRTFGSRLINDKLYIPSNLGKQGIFELFVVTELFTEYLKSKIMLTQNQHEPIMRELALLLSNLFFRFEKTSLILNLIEIPVILKTAGEIYNLTQNLQEVLNPIHKKMHLHQDYTELIKFYFHFIQLFDTYKVRFTVNEFFNLFYHSCIMLNPSQKVKFEENVYPIYASIFYNKNTAIQSEKAMLLNLLFSLHGAEPLNLTTILKTVRVIAENQSVRKEILKMEKLISDFLLDYIVSKVLSYKSNHVIRDRILDLTVEINNNSNYSLQDFTHELRWKPKNRIELQEQEITKENDLYDIRKSEYKFVINTKGNVQISCKIFFTNPIFPSLKMERIIVLDKLTV
jgi:hypothetical protein